MNQTYRYKSRKGWINDFGPISAVPPFLGRNTPGFQNDRPQVWQVFKSLDSTWVWLREGAMAEVNLKKESRQMPTRPSCYWCPSCWKVVSLPEAGPQGNKGEKMSLWGWTVISTVNAIGCRFRQDFHLH